MAKKPTNPKIGVTDAQLITRIRSALRKVSSSTTRKAHIKAVRFHKTNPETGRPKWHVRCVLCGKEMPCGKRIFKTKLNGEKYKKETSAYDVDHVHGNPPLTCLKELSAYAESLFFGECRVLCWECHREHGKKKR